MTPKIPTNQIHWESLFSDDGILRQVVTSDKTRNKWYLYDVAEDGLLIKIETCSLPIFKKSIFSDNKC